MGSKSEMISAHHQSSSLSADATLYYITKMLLTQVAVYATPVVDYW